MQVVVEQPTMTVPMAVATPVPTIHVQQPRRAHDFFTFSIVLMLCCFAHGNIIWAMLTIPAFFCSTTV